MLRKSVRLPETGPNFEPEFINSTPGLGLGTLLVDLLAEAGLRLGPLTGLAVLSTAQLDSLAQIHLISV